MTVRPLGITILAGVHMLLAVLLILGGVYGIIAGVPSLKITKSGKLVADPRAPTTGFLVFGVIGLMVGAALLIVGWGLWKGRPWAWLLEVGGWVLGTPFVVLLTLILVAAGIWIGLLLPVIEALIMWYLFRPNVKNYFNVHPIIFWT